MKYSFLIILLFSISACSMFKHTTIVKVHSEAPFNMPKIKAPDFSKCEKISIIDFGAIQDDIEKTSHAIKLAIEKANKIGGGIVVIPKGDWLTKKIHLKSNVNLHLDDSAVLIFSDNPEYYLPPVYTTWEGLECYNYSPLIYAFQCKNIAITGKGKLMPKMNIWKEWFSRPHGHMNSLKWLYYKAANNCPVIERQMVNDSANFRPHCIQFNRCENILIDGITILNSPFWTIHPYMSKDIIIRNVKVYARGHNNDGVDPEMSQNILIENCIFDQGDDAIAVKSGRNQDAWRLHTPSKNIVIRNCKVKNGHQLLAIGSELSGGIENVYMNNCHVEESAKMFHLLFIKTNERRGGYVKNIYMSNITSGAIDYGVLGIETDVLYQWRDMVPTIEKRLTPVSDIYLDNITATKTQFISRILGQKEIPIENVILKNVTVDTIIDTTHIHENVIGFVEE